MVAFKGAIFLLLLLLLFPHCYTKTKGSPGENTLQWDGPYIFVNGQETEILTVEKGKKKVRKVKTGGIRIRVTVPGLSKRILVIRTPAKVEPDRYNGVNKILFLSDIHGQWERMSQLLMAHRVMDKKLKWTWGRGHLVIVGDVFDRGPAVTECLWTLYHLERQAKRKGGRVHLLLGNHEIMILQGNDQYAHTKYRTISRQILEIPMRLLYGPNTILGDWLRSKHTLLRINDLLITHAGINPEIPRKQLSLSQINSFVRDHLDQPVQEDETANLLFGNQGPFWFRGFIPAKFGTGSIPISFKELGDILKFFDVSRIIVGHTTLPEPMFFYEGLVLAVDSGIQHGDRGEALLLNKGDFFRITSKGELIPFMKKNP